MPANIDNLMPAMKAILANELGLNLTVDEIADDASLVEDGLNLDSILIVELIGILEERFGFQFQDADLRTATFSNLQSLAEVVALRGGR